MKTCRIHENPAVRNSACSVLAHNITSNQEVVHNVGNANVEDLSKCTRGLSFVLIIYLNAEAVSCLHAHVVSIVCIVPSSKTNDGSCTCSGKFPPTHGSQCTISLLLGLYEQQRKFSAS